MITCTFVGQRNAFYTGINAELESTLLSILHLDSEFTFLVNGIGEFDRMCASAIRRLKQQYGYQQWQLA